MPISAPGSRSSPPIRGWHRCALALIEVLLPSSCLACSRPTREWRPLMGLCVSCRGRLERPRSPCRRCGAPLGTSSSTRACGACLQRPPAFDRLLAASLYRDPLDEVVRHLKYDRLIYLGAHLAQLMASEWGDEFLAAELITAVPLHWRRHLARGFDHALEIARPLGRELGIPVRKTLRRTLSTRPQASLGRMERLRNPTGSITFRRDARVKGRVVLLVDDVMTTGATLDAAARALKAAGARRVVAAVAGQTPPPERRRTWHWQAS